VEGEEDGGEAAAQRLVCRSSSASDRQPHDGVREPEDDVEREEDVPKQESKTRTEHSREPASLPTLSGSNAPRYNTDATDKYPAAERPTSRVLRRQAGLVGELAADPPRDEEGDGGEEENAVEQAREDLEVGERVQKLRRRGGGRRGERDERREEVDGLRGREGQLGDEGAVLDEDVDAP